MPWKGISDPYKIWLSEIILQQTRVEQGLKYFYLFTENYPCIADLANAKDEEVFKLWQGLGYYNRCRNMLATARNIHLNYQGCFPGTYDEILALKGIGEYTAAAIASFAFSLPYAVVDGNVVRVLSRVFGLQSNFFDSKGKREIQQLATSLLDKENPAIYNQAIMDLGATVCKPQNPLCLECPFTSICHAFLKNEIVQFPVKKVRRELKERHFHFLVFHTKKHLYLQKRTGDDIWKDLYAFYTIESTQLRKALLPSFIDKPSLRKPLLLKQVLSHQRIIGQFYQVEIELETAVSLNELNLIKIKKTDMNKFAFPKLIVSFFENNNYL